MRSPLVALFLSVGLLFGQAKKPAKKSGVAAPVAEATGQWILGTVGVGSIRTVRSIRPDSKVWPSDSVTMARRASLTI